MLSQHNATELFHREQVERLTADAQHPFPRALTARRHRPQLFARLARLAPDATPRRLRTRT